MSAALLEDVMVIYSYLVHPSTLSSHICSGNVHLLHPVGEGGRVRPAEVPGDELVEAGGQNGSLSSC